MGLFYSSPSKPNFFRIGRGAPLPMRPPKKPRNTALTWFPKLLNRIRALPQNLALGMKTHIFEHKCINFIFYFANLSAFL